MSSYLSFAHTLQSERSLRLAYRPISKGWEFAFWNQIDERYNFFPAKNIELLLMQFTENMNGELLKDMQK